MLSYINKLIFVLIAVSLFSCTETNETESDDNLRIIDVLPSNPNIGDELKIILNKELESYEYDGYIYFNNDWSYSDYTRNDTIFAFLPYIKNSSSAEIKLIINKENKSFELTKTIEINNVCLNGICIIKNDEGKISEQDIFPKDFMGNIPKWEMINNNDTIIISSFRITADEANETFSLKFLNNTPDVLPGFVNFTRIKNESNGAPPTTTTYDTLKNGLIKIEDWNNNGIYSGIIYAELEPFESRKYFLPRTIFWLNK